MRLYITRASPFARKTLIVAQEVGAGEDLNVVEITQATIPTNAIDAVSAVNPLGKIPALEADDQVLFDSVVIAEYLDIRFSGALFPIDHNRRWQALTIHALADGIVEAGIAVRLEAMRPDALRWPEWVAAHRRKMCDALDWMEQRCGSLDFELDVGQIALACAVDWLSFRDVYHDALVERPRLAAWHRQILERRSFRDTDPRS